MHFRGPRYIMELTSMKKSLLALALSGTFALSAHAQSSVTLYGVIDTGILYANNQGGHSSWQEVSAATENTVYGLKGSEDLGGGLHAVFKLENGFNLNNGSLYSAASSIRSMTYWVPSLRPAAVTAATCPRIRSTTTIWLRTR
jgi:hypothetical protein